MPRLALSRKSDMLRLRHPPQRRRRRVDEAGRFPLRAESRRALGHDVVECALAVLGNEGVEENEAADALGGALGDAGHHHPSVAVADEHHLAQVLHLEEPDDILHVHVEVDVGAREVRALAKPGEGGPEYIVTSVPQDGCDKAPFPTAGPGAVHQNESRHDLPGSFRIQSTSAATTAPGCSGTRAWPASAIVTTETRSPNSSRRSFAVARGLKASCSACRSSSGTPPAPHHCSCGVASPAARWLAFTSG